MANDEESIGYAMPLTQKEGRQSTGAFGPLALMVQVLLAIAFCFTEIDIFSHSVFESLVLEDMFRGMAFMGLAGFGFLMSFLKAFGIGAVANALFVFALGLQWAVLVGPAMEHGINDELKFDFYTFLKAEFAVLTALIAFGAVLGKTSPTQALFFTLSVIAAYSANMTYFLIGFLEIMDVGGSIWIHVFGAVFGIVCSFAMGPAQNEANCEGSRRSQTFALLGSTFLGIWWPSLITAGLTVGGLPARTAVLNTIIALAGSGTSSFAWAALCDRDRPAGSPWRGGRLMPHVVGNARLAGGVSIGAVAGVAIGFGPAMLIGNLAGIVSSWGYIQEFVPLRYDTCGIANLHLYPGLLGGLASVLVPLVVDGTGILPDSQVFGLLGTIIFAAASGGITGAIMKCLGPPTAAFYDGAFIDVAQEAEEEEALEQEKTGSTWFAPCAAPRDHEPPTATNWRDQDWSLFTSRPSNEPGH